MNAKIKKTYRERLKEIFYRIRTHPWHQRVMSLPYWVRALIAGLLFILGIIGLLTPIPAGWLMLISSFVLVFGLHIVKKQVVKGFFYFRLHRFIEWIKYKWNK